MELPFLLEHGERVHVALVVLAAALGALGARHRRLRARRAQARTQRGALGEALGAPEEGPATLRGRLRGGEGEAAAHDDPHTATRAERLALETEAGLVAIDGAVRVEVGSEERVGPEGTAPRRSLRFGDEVLAAGRLERRTREAEGYRSDASEWALVPGGVGIVHLAALSTWRAFVPLRRLVAGALLGAIFGFGAMAAIGYSAVSVRPDDEATEPPLSWTLAATMGPWAREEALRETEYWLLRHLEGDEENADAYVALQALRGLPGHYALGGLVENGYLARAEDVLARSPDAERHDVERVARAYGATGDFVSGSRMMAAHPERMAEGSFAQPEVLMHLLAGNLQAARRAQEREVDEDDRACLAAYLRARLGIDAEAALAELMTRLERDDACRLLHADLAEGEARLARLGPLAGSEEADYPLENMALLLRAEACAQSPERWRTGETADAADEGGEAGRAAPTGRAGSDGANGANRAAEANRANDATDASGPGDAAGETNPCAIEGLPRRGASALVDPRQGWGYDGVPALAARVARALEGRDHPRAWRLASDAHQQVALFRGLTMDLEGAKASIDAARRALRVSDAPSSDRRDELRAMELAVQALEGEVGAARRAAEAEGLGRIVGALRVLDPSVDRDALAAAGLLDADADTLLRGGEVELPSPRDGLLALVRSDSIPSSLGRWFREEPRHHAMMDPHYNVSELAQERLLWHAAGQPTDGLERMLEAYRVALSAEDTAVPLQVASR